MRPKFISGKVKFQNISTGFWGIVTDSGDELRPTNLPEQLKQENARIQFSYIEDLDDMSMFMWGTPIFITSFHTLFS